MKTKNIIIIHLSIISILALILLWDERKKSNYKSELIRKYRKENENIRRGYFELLEKFLKEEGKVTPDIIDELQTLKSRIDNWETDLHLELESVIKRVNDGEGTKAVKDLAKIVECKLKEKVADDFNFKKPKMLHNLLEHAKECKWITNRQYENGMKLKEIRNEESHTLAPQKHSFEIGLCLFAGIDIIYSLK